jgi:hypothetical protein
VPPLGSMRHPPSGGSRRRRTGPGWAVNRCFSAVCCGGADNAGQIRPRGSSPGRALSSAGATGAGALLQAVAGDLGGELGAGGDVELGEHVHQVGLQGPPRDVLPARRSAGWSALSVTKLATACSAGVRLAQLRRYAAVLQRRCFLDGTLSSDPRRSLAGQLRRPGSGSQSGCRAGLQSAGKPLAWLVHQTVA